VRKRSPDVFYATEPTPIWTSPSEGSNLHYASRHAESSQKSNCTSSAAVSLSFHVATQRDRLHPPGSLQNEASSFHQHQWAGRCPPFRWTGGNEYSGTTVTLCPFKILSPRGRCAIGHLAFHPRFPLFDDDKNGMRLSHSARGTTHGRSTSW
jgi:hypothetical protein